ncbi:hypothetical protein SAMN04487820_108246 [Actinopolyspora mzabensis]|uniref:HTTM-like domain-containing protein n=1 Tax=Actinopolyspora mzabensis TaxID=995066 RepID=A0A1G9CCL4_ACTMZ|nr:hypothetical protein [Actinopolyspora mzabensis]SDK49412.1 hypothetical protein SAMN04487820_108246 [Actinopolyspora mzabensis]
MARERGHEDAVDTEGLEATLDNVEQLTAFGTLISSLEYLAAGKSFADDDLLSWDVARTRHKALAGRVGDLLTPLMKSPGINVVFAARAAGSVVLLVPRAPAAAKTTATAVLTASNYALHLRTPYGSDGSEHISMITYTSLLASRLARSDERAQQACLHFIALQSCLSYGVAGISKLVSPVWRNGTAVRDIFRTHMYGHSRVYELLKSKPWAARLLAWVTITGETGFPLVLIAPKPVARGILASGLSFHGGNAVFMGLNRFLWAFLGTYPAVAYTSRNLGPIRGRSKSRLVARLTGSKR